ncbi:MAG: PaaI family thioesterase [Rhodoblastus sp.]
MNEPAGAIEVEFAGAPQFLNPAGTIQGGILAAMLDDTMAPAAMAALGGRQMARTLELKVNFMRPAKIGTIIGLSLTSTEKPRLTAGFMLFAELASGARLRFEAA